LVLSCFVSLSVAVIWELILLLPELLQLEIINAVMVIKKVVFFNCQTYFKKPLLVCSKGIVWLRTNNRRGDHTNLYNE
jgi:hypothetical protein